VRTPPSVRWIVRQRVAAGTVVVVAAGLILGVTGSAGAAPTPTISQVEAKIRSLESKSAQLDQQYAQVRQQLAQTNQRLALINKQIAADASHFASLQKLIESIAVSDYESGNLNSSLAMLTSGNAQQILNRSSILLELSNANSAQIDQFLAATRQLTNAQQLAQRTKVGILQLKHDLLKRKATMAKLTSQQNALLASLQPAQQATLTAGSGGTTHANDPLPTATQAEKAVKFAYGALGCPYVYGGTGPCGSGYDCSGLTQAAWAYAGVSIPRTSYDQWNQLTSVSLANIQPGDILVFLGGGHVGLYVGGNKLIDAPHTGLDVELIPFSGWYRSELVGIVRP
jgi:peptidoglycan DL-endopeptidase CwlO